MRHRLLPLAVCVTVTALSVAACSHGSSSTAAAPPAPAGSSSPIVSTTSGTDPSTGTNPSMGSDPSTGTDPSMGSDPSGDASIGSGAAQADVCSLMTPAQASSINNVTYDSSRSKTPATGFDVCTYHNSGKAVSPVDIQDLDVTVISMSGCWAQLQSAAAQAGGVTNVAGVGDAAFGTGIGLDVKVGDRCLTIEGLTFAELKGNYAPDIAMAKVILGGLH